MATRVHATENHSEVVKKKRNTFQSPATLRFSKTSMTPLHLKCLMFGIPIRSGITGVVTFFCQSKQCSHVPPIVWQLPQMEMIKLNYDRLCLQAYQIADVLARLRSKVPLFGSSECLPPMFASSCSKKKTSSSSFADASNTN